MIYLDSAATSLYKPAPVYAAVLDAIQSMGSPGRGDHAPAARAAECCFRCREKLAELFHVSDVERVVFTFNATHGLNIAIRSLIRPGARVLISGWEHNAVTRPLHALGARLTVIDTPLFAPEAFLRAAEQALESVDAAVCTHVSNVFGYILPVEALAEQCRRKGVPLILDLSQSAGLLDVDFTALGAEFAAMPGHKGLLGPQGTGVLLCKNDAAPLLYGGSGSDSAARTMPEHLPDRLEAGTHNVPGIAGLSAGLDYLLRRGTASVRDTEQRRLAELAGLLADEGGLRLFLSEDPERQSGVLSAVPEDVSCEALGEALGKNGVAVRSGLHCAPLAHETAGTSATGTVRFSFSPFSTRSQMVRTAEICKKLLKKP
ncbi:MAG: aminotransferase class V-fold PLP-dependent enzyme [Oscillospiraceae bacterium]|nr:aminotransferase class V-fold PLP-dependent enzyme [Oscillospiraceae bacterium]